MERKSSCMLQDTIELCPVWLKLHSEPLLIFHIPVCFSAQLTHTCTFEILYLVYLHPTPNGLLQILLWCTSSCLYLFSTTYTKTSFGTFWSMLTGLFGNYINTHMRYVRHFHPNFILIGTTLISDIPWHIWNIYLSHTYHLYRLTKYHWVLILHLSYSANTFYLQECF